jgi:hypothetical protein
MTQISLGFKGNFWLTSRPLFHGIEGRVTLGLEFMGLSLNDLKESHFALDR